MSAKTSNTNTKAEVKETERKEVEEIISLWRKTSNSGTKYFTGKCGKDNVVGFYNLNKKNPKEPDLNIYLKDAEGNTEKEALVSLWCNASKNGNKYLSGKIHERRVVGFFTKAEALEKYANIPYVKIYWSESMDEADGGSGSTDDKHDKKDVSKKAKATKPVKPEFEEISDGEDLPF